MATLKIMTMKALINSLPEDLVGELENNVSTRLFSDIYLLHHTDDFYGERIRKVIYARDKQTLIKSIDAIVQCDGHGLYLIECRVRKRSHSCDECCRPHYDDWYTLDHLLGGGLDIENMYREYLHSISGDYHVESLTDHLAAQKPEQKR